MYNIKQCLSMVSVVNWSKKKEEIEHVSLKMIENELFCFLNSFISLQCLSFIRFFLFIFVFFNSFCYCISFLFLLLRSKNDGLSICSHNAKHFVIYNLFIHHRRSIPIIKLLSSEFERFH